MKNNSLRIIGIDPGLTHCGWGVIECEGNKLKFVACGVISAAKKAPMAERLSEIHLELKKAIEQYAPHEAAVEETFVNANPLSALKLGQARGVALVTPALSGLPVAEYAANQVKKAVVGTGHADKDQIAMMVARLLPGANAAKDAADALAIAICHAHMSQTAKLWKNKTA